MPTTIYKPGSVIVKGLRTSLAGSQLVDGYFQAIDGWRWDTGALMVRNGIATVSSSAPGTLYLGGWSGSLNGTYYIVTAWLVSSRVAVYSFNILSGAFTELTDAGDAAHPTTWAGDATGKTRIGTPLAITGATNAAPIVVTTAAHGFNTGDTVAVSSVGGNTAANGNWKITKVSATTFSLDGSVGNSAYTSGGSACRYSQVTFCVHTIPRKVISTTVYPPLDVLSINTQNDYPLVWNPTIDPTAGPALAEHRNISLPTGGTTFNYLHRQGAFLPVALGSGKTFTSKKADTTTNQTDFKLIASAVVPYNSGADTCIDLVLTSPQVAGDFTKVAFAAGVSFPGEQMNMHWQAALTALSDHQSYTKIQVSADDTTYYTIFDPTSSDAAETLLPITTAYDTLSNRTMLTYSLKGVPDAARSIRYIKFIRPAASSVSYTMTLLALTGAGAGSGFYGGTEWAIANSDHWGMAESGGIRGISIGSDLLKNMGGPSVVTSGSTTVAGTKVPVAPTVLYDFSLFLKNQTAATIAGGLQGIPANIDIYFRTSEESLAGGEFLYWHSANFYTPTLGGLGADHQWSMVAGFLSAGTPKAVAVIQTEATGWTAFDRDLRDPGFPLPSAFNIAMPRAATVATANQRTFAGAIKDASGNYCYGDLYFSALGFPFRFASTQESETAASRLTFAERVRVIVMIAAASNGGSTIYVATDQGWHALGTAGGFIGSGYTSSSLTIAVRINDHGTNEPGSVSEKAGVIYYFDQQGQIIRFQGGSARNISRASVDDKAKNIPYTRRGFVSAVFFRDRYMPAFTPASGTKNTQILGYNQVLEDWEFCDTLPSTVVAQGLLRVFDKSQVGSGQRLLVFSDDSKVYAYEEGTTEPGSSIGPNVQLRTRSYQAPDMRYFRFGVNQIMMDHHAQVSAADVTLNIDCYYKPRGAEFRGTVNLTDADSPVKTQAIRKDTKVRAEVTSTAKAEEGWEGFMDLNGHAGAGKILYRWDCDIDMTSKEGGERV